MHDTNTSSSNIFLTLVANESFPFFLIAIVCIIFLSIVIFVFRKGIDNFLTNNTFVKDSVPPITTSTSNQVYTDKIDLQEVENDEQQSKVDSAETNNNKTELKDIYTHLQNKNFEEADKLFNQWLTVNSNDINEISRYYYNCYIEGKTAYLEKLKHIRDKQSKFYGNFWLGNCYEYFSEYNIALECLSQALQYADSDLERLRASFKIGKIKYKSQDISFTFKEFDSLIDTVPDKKELILESIGDLLYEDENYFQASLYYIKYLELNPTNQLVLFRTAFGMTKYAPETALYYYHSLLTISPDHASALNNIAILQKDFHLNNKRVQSFKKAIENNEAYAAGNLASLYIDNGFFNEAKEILEPHLNSSFTRISQEYSRLSELQAKEQKDEDAILANAKREKIFFQLYADYKILNQSYTNEILIGLWTFKDQEIQITARLISEWETEDKKHKLEILDFESNGFKVNYTLSNKSSSGLLGFHNDRYTGFGYLQNVEHLEILLFSDNQYKEIVTMIKV